MKILLTMGVSRLELECGATYRVSCRTRKGEAMTPHNHAKPGDYAEAVLMPGDPLRAKWVAETFLSDAQLVNSVRNCLGYTGTWNGKRVSVQATGMGQPSLSIYVHELINVYGLKTLIRIGTCGGLNAKVKVRDLIIAQAASTDTTIVKDGFGPFNFAPIADYGLPVPPPTRPRRRACATMWATC
jgi:purine-nucleoside phosphorylase